MQTFLYTLLCTGAVRFKSTLIKSKFGYLKYYSYINNMTLEEFKNKRQEWIKDWFNNYRLLDIDFEAFMLMQGVSPDLYKKLNEESINDLSNKDTNFE